jgi:hypothetical protein
MSRNILFISVDTIKDRTGLHFNVDPKLVYPDILFAQDAYILPMLGTALYNRLQDGIDCKDLDCDEEALLNEYITPTLVYQVMAELPMALSYQFYNKGVVKKSGEGQTEPSASELTEVAQRYQSRAEFYRQRLMKYLRQNASQNVVSWAQLYQNPGSGFDTIVPDAEAYTISIWLGDDDCCAGKTFEEKYQGNINRCCGK